jgi:large subunit ribosomal protein L4
MTELRIRDKSGNEVETLTVDDAVFGKRVNRQLLRDVVVMYEANKRQGTACTKTRSEVAGSGKKPWRQKGTGRARAGCIRSPLWRKGGTVFGPKPRDYSYSMPGKMLRKALASALLVKMRSSEICIVESLAFEKPSSKKMAAILANLGLERSVMVIIGASDGNAYLSARNLPNVTVRRCQDVNAREILVARSVLATKEAFAVLKERVQSESAGGVQ